jgi:uncharacterized FAD-dependent dehydrogenase
MRIRVSQVAMPLGGAEADVPALAAVRVGIDPAAVRRAQIVRRSLDARHQHRICFVYTVDLDVPDDLRPEKGTFFFSGHEHVDHGEDAGPEKRSVPFGGREAPAGDRPPLPGPIVVVGAGPAGLFAALALAENGYAPLLLERGQPVERRIDDLAQFQATRQVNPESNWLFGEGGAGAMSDGKLTSRIGDPRIARVLETLVDCGAPADILIDAQPHVGTDRLRDVLPRLRARITAAGGEVRFNTRVDGLVVERGALRAVRAGETRLPAGLVCLAIGHSARDTFEGLARAGVPMEPKPFQLGLRIEHRQADLDRARYGPSAGHPALPPATYQLVAKGRRIPRSVATFCMCPGGQVVPAVSEPSRLCTNGMSAHARNGPFANSALVVTMDPNDFGRAALDGIEFQRRWEGLAFELAGGDYTAPAQRVGDFLASRDSKPPLKTSYPFGVRPVSMREILPATAAESIARALPVLADRLSIFADPDAVLLGPETRATSPVRILRDPETRVSPGVAGLYPIGEGAGYAGGIMSAAVDGLKTAEAIIRAYAPPARSV